MTDYSGGMSIAYMLDNDHIVTTTTATDVPGLSFSARENGVYCVTFTGSCMSSSSVSGVGLQLDAPAGSRVTGMNYNLDAATQKMSVGEQVAPGSIISATSGVRASNVDIPVQGGWLVKVGATPGLVQLQARPAGLATLTVKAESLMLVWAY